MANEKGEATVRLLAKEEKRAVEIAQLLARISRWRDKRGHCRLPTSSYVLRLAVDIGLDVLECFCDEVAPADPLPVITILTTNELKWRLKDWGKTDR